VYLITRQTAYLYLSRGSGPLSAGRRCHGLVADHPPASFEREGFPTFQIIDPKEVRKDTPSTLNPVTRRTLVLG
jgi:hypothetical protein